MSYVKHIVCLANSRKISGRCVAGREIVNSGVGPWIRPVSKRATREISELDRRYENGCRANVLDMIRIPMLQSIPNQYHVEDHLIDDEDYWEKTGVADWATVTNYVEPTTGPLWVNRESTYHGLRDKIAEAEATNLSSSLVLIRPQNLQVQVNFESGYQGGGKRRVRANFSLAEVNYHLQITDPVIEQRYLGGDDGSYPINDAVLCISLSEPFNGYVFKLVATILTPDMAT